MPEEYVTKTGKRLTDEDIEELANEAEEGYDVSHLVNKAKAAPNQQERAMFMGLLLTMERELSPEMFRVVFEDEDDINPHNMGDPVVEFNNRRFKVKLIPQED